MFTMKLGILLALFFVMVIIISAGGVMAMGDSALSISSNGAEAIAVSSSAIDIYVPPDHTGVSISRGDKEVGELPPGSKRLRDDHLEPNTSYTYTIKGLGSDPVSVTERTFPKLQDESSYDVVVVGATASGTAAAVTAARMGASVALIEETNRIGGMVSNGLGAADIRDKSRSSGFFEEFRARIASYYGIGNGLTCEPRVANAIMKSIVYGEPNITLFRMTRADDVIKKNSRVSGVKVTNIDTYEGGTINGRITIDATAEADIAAKAGVKFRVQREERTSTEPHAGFIYYDNNLGEILPGSTGASDNRVQSYAYLFVIKDYPGQDKTVSEPYDYDAANYKYSPAWKDSWAFTSGRLPNGKFEVNQHPWGTDWPGINYDYPTDDRFDRGTTADKYKRRALGYLYYLQNELGMKSLGLAEDEFPDTSNFPPTLYVREARRMVGRSTMNESDIILGPSRAVPSSIAIGDYPMDSHATQEVTSPTERNRGEGEFWLLKFTTWYKVPLGVIIPNDTPGLIVSTAVSSTHVAYGTLRMEPVRMSIGQAAGTLAGIAISYGVPFEKIPAEAVQYRLLDQKAYLTWFSDVDASTKNFAAIQMLAVRGFFVGPDFRPNDNLTVEEAKWLMRRLVLVEKNGPSAEDESPPPTGGTPITRAQFAELLVTAKEETDKSWSTKSIESSHYSYLTAGTETAKYAEVLYKHKIDAEQWAGRPPSEQGGPVFAPEDPITRADAAEAIWIAHKPVALSSKLGIECK